MMSAAFVGPLVMLEKLGRLFRIKTRPEAFLIIYALATGAVQRGELYLHQFPGLGGQLLYLATTGAVFMAGGKMLDCIRHEQESVMSARQEFATGPR